MPIINIEKDFRQAANFGSDDEVELFRKLASSIVKYSNAVYIDETHGATKANVSFTLTDGTNTRCEIADLLIIVKSMDSPFLRATFWQAKKENKSKWISKGISDSHIDFTGQFNQWDLLSRRPPIQGIAPFNPPYDLLSCFDSASIGSFGIFCERVSKIEVIHSVAEFITCRSPISKHPTMLINAYLEKYYYAHNEVMVRTSLITFLEALFAHQIGALLIAKNTVHQWLVSYASGKVSNSGKSIPDGFFDGYDLSQPIDKSDKSDGISVLLIDTDQIFSER